MPPIVINDTPEKSIGVCIPEEQADFILTENGLILMTELETPLSIE